MASNHRRSSKHKELNNLKKILGAESSDVDGDVPKVKKLKLNQQRTKLKAACRKNISLETSSSEDSSSDAEENYKRKYMSLIDERNSKRRTLHKDYQRQSAYKFNKSDVIMEDSISKRSKRMAIEKAVKMGLDDKYYTNLNEIVVNGYVKKYAKGERVVTQNFKPIVEKIVDSLKSTFSQFKYQMHRFQLKFLQPDIITLQDAGDVIFVFSSIICKLKEELDVKQQDLTDSYINCIMMCNSSNVVSNVNYKHHNRDLQEGVNMTSESSINSQIISPNICQKQSVKSSKSSNRCVEENDKEELPLQEIKNSNNNYQTKGNVMTHNNENMVETISDNDSNVSTCSTVMISAQVNRHNGKCANVKTV